MAATNNSTTKTSVDEGDSPGRLTRTRGSGGTVPFAIPDYSGSSSSTGVTTTTVDDLDILDAYKMNHRHRGKCVVFNHELFDPGFPVRTGSTEDVKKIKETFATFGFVVETHNNLEYQKICDKILELSTANYEEHDCICIFVLTHGWTNDMICSKDAIYMAEKIWKPFAADNCKTLAGKPKLFFFQACRGFKTDDGVVLVKDNASEKMHTSPATSSMISDAIKASVETSAASSNTEADGMKATYKIPSEPDFFIAHSTAKDHCAWRVTKGKMIGTWFVKSLCDVLTDCASQADLVKMMTITARVVATTKSACKEDKNEPTMKQVPSIMSTLVRSLYLTPKDNGSLAP